VAQADTEGSDEAQATYDGALSRSFWFWLKTLLWLAAFVGLVALDEAVFRLLLDRSYLRWFLENGVYVGLAFAIVTLAWGDLNRLTGLISAHPLEYALACAAVVEVSFHGVTAMHRPPEPGEDRRLTGWDGFGGRPIGLGWLDNVLSALFAVVMWILGFGWLLVFAPLQYFVTLLAGAPARQAVASPGRAWFRASGTDMHVYQVRADGGDDPADEVPDDAVESGFTAKPVTFTSVLSTGLLLITALTMR
jgi:hypothetical protein